MMKRYAVTTAPADTAARYIPACYEVLGIARDPDNRVVTIIGGRDNAGWTLDGYVIPRLQSGLYGAREIDLSDPLMKQIPG